MNETRKLAAILSADAAGFSRRMHDDEVGTHARLRACREVIDRRREIHGVRHSRRDIAFLLHTFQSNVFDQLLLEVS